MTLLICPVRPGDTNEELRYALRSWETNLILPNLWLMTVGHKPSWLSPDRHVEGNFYKSAPFAVFDNIKRGAEAACLLGHNQPVIFMNDDFFCLDPVGAVLPVRRNCTLAEHIAQFPAGTGMWWPASLRLTASWLAEQGFPRPDSYEVHRPLVADAEGMLSTLSRWDLDSGDTVPQWRTMYGVLNEVHAYPVSDAKLGLRQTGIGTPWVSTSDQSWRRFALAMQKRFQKPSRWEK